MRRTREEILDELLVLRSRDGDRKALEALVARWHGRLLVHARRLTAHPDAAADVVQEAWIAIVRGLRGLDDPVRFRAWAYRIVGNKARDWIRKEGRRRRRNAAAEREEAPAVVPGPPRPGDDPEEAGRERRIGRLRDALTTLPEERRAILGMFYRDEMSIREIAAALGIPEGTVKSRLWHARESLRERLEE